MEDYLNPIFRWLHIFAGVMWIGLLYFFNFVNASFAGTMDGDTKKKVVPELMPRALYWFRMGAAWTWATGLVLMGVVYYHGGLTFDDPDTSGYGLEFFSMVAVTFLGVFAYDALYKSPLASNVRAATITSFILIVIVVVVMKEWAGFSFLFTSSSVHLNCCRF